MTNREYRIGIVGASSLLGKELSEELASSLLAQSDVVLLDVEEAAGQVTAAADEVSFIQPLEASSFERMDFVFFAGGAEVTKRHWLGARRAGVTIVDLTYALEGEKMFRCEPHGWLRCSRRRLSPHCRISEHRRWLQPILLR